MERRLKVQVREAVAIVTLAALPAPDAEPAPADPGFEPDLRGRLAGALDLVLQDAGVKAVLLRAGPGGWPVAADPLSDWQDSAGVPGMAALAARLEGCGKPVVMALSGRVTGGTLALALAAGWSIADTQMRLALPETALAALPGGDVLWRLARVAGAGETLRLAVSGRELSAAEALAIGVLDGAVEQGDVDAAALSVALSVARALAEPVPQAPPPPRRDPAAGLADAAAYLAELAAARRALAPPPMRDFQARVIDCIEAALLLPGDEAREFAEVARAELAAAPLGRALAHVAQARRRAARLAGLPATMPQVPQRIGFWLPEAEAAQLIAGLAEAGFALTLAAQSAEPLEPVLRDVARLLAEAEKDGRLAGAARSAAWERLDGGIGTAALAACEMVFAPAESAPDLRRELAPDCQLVQLSGAAAHVDADCAGLRLPAPGLAELTPAPGAAPEVIAGVFALLRRAGFMCLRAGAGRGGIAARLGARLHAAAERAVLAGATPAGVDAALAALGLAEPPFRRADRIGPERMVAEARDAGREPGVLSLLLCELGPGGAPGRYYAATGAVDPETEALLPGLRQELGLVPVALSAAQIRARALAELADEGAALLQSAEAHRAGDVDLAALTGLGLAPTAGGPMFAADEAGLLATREVLRGLLGEGAPVPVTLWDVLIKNGRRFADLDRRPVS
jgi:enoyl-CoA hydratase/carnithine racemase/3-hydroxyacyl-CoA dehydrogenase